VPAATLAPADERDAGPLPARRWRRTAAIEHAVATVFTLAVSWPFLRRHTYITGFDTVAYSGPNLNVTLEAWRHFRLALWNGLIFGGVTHIGNPAAGALYPLKLLALPFGISRGLAVLVVVHLLILANGMVALLSWRLRLRPPAATVGAVALAGSGLVMIKMVQFEQLLVLAWVPLLLALVHWVITARRPTIPAAVTAVVTTLVLIAGHPQTVYSVAPLVLLFAIAIAWDTPAWPRLGFVAAAGFVGLLLAAPQLLPEIAATGEGALSGRRPISVVESPVYRLDFGHTLRALLGNPLKDFPDSDAGTYEALSFVGAATAALAVAGLVDGIRHRRRRALTIVLGAVAFAAVVAAYGPRTWFYRVAYDHVPLFAQARVPARWLTVTVIATVVLAAMGTDAVVSRRLDRKTLAVVGAAVVVITLLVVTQVMSTPGRRAVGLWIVAAGAVLVVGLVPTPRRRIFAIVLVVVPALVVMAELGLASYNGIATRSSTAASEEQYGGEVVRFLDGQPGRSVALTFDDLGDPAYLVASLRPNANALFDIPSIDGYDGGVQVTDRWAAAMSSMANVPFDPEPTLRSQIAIPVDTGLLGRFGVRWVVIDTRSGDPSTIVPGFQGPLATDGTLEVYENPAWRGEAVAWFATQPATDGKAAADRLATGGAAPNAALLTDGSEPLACSGECTPVGLTVERSRPERAAIAADLPRDAIVALDEQADKGWSATVDGKSAATVAVDGFYVGVRVPAGRHEVRFSYTPRGFRVGLLLAALGLAILIAAAVVALQARRAVARSTAGLRRFT
jgi:Bacterial membrane protein YfhO